MMSLIAILLLVAALVLAVMYVFSRGSGYKSAVAELINFQTAQKKPNAVLNLFKLIKSNIYDFYYAKFLKFTDMKPKTLLRIKAAIFLLVFLMALAVELTNIQYQKDMIFNKYDYKMDFIYRSNAKVDEDFALSQEIACLKAALEKISKSEMVQGAGYIEQRIKNIAKDLGIIMTIPEEAFANKVYYRLKDYYEASGMSIFKYIIGALAVSFLPEVLLAFRGIFRRAEARQELKFLKKLVIVNGSIKPVDFYKVLNILIEKSKLYRAFLEDVRDKNLKNTVDNHSIYQNYIKKSKRIDEKLFFEKLNQANNYDFEQAVQNIQNEFRLEKREEARKVRKKIEVIHIIGLTGLMLIITALIMYLIIPWTNMYDMNNFGY